MFRLGIAGCGAAGKRHVSSYLKNPDVLVVGVSDIDHARAESFGNEYNIKALSFEELLEMVDIIDISAPGAAHLCLIEKAAARGKDIICESPLARNLDDAERIIDLCRKNNVKLIPVHFSGFAGPLARLEEKLQKCEKYRKGVFRISRRNPGIPESVNDWRKDFSLSGGITLDVLIQDIAFLTKNLGHVARVLGHSAGMREGLDGEYVLASLGFENGSIAHLEGNWLEKNNKKDEFEYAYKNGIITFSEQFSSPLGVVTNSEFLTESPLSYDMYDVGFREIFAAMKKGELPPVTCSEAYEALKVALAVIESSITGEVVVLDMQGVGL